MNSAILPRPARRHVPDAIAWILIVLAVSVTLSLFLSLKLGVLILIFAAVGWWSWKHPASALITLLLISPLLPLFKATQTIGNITLVKDILILILCVRLYILPLLKQQLPYRRNIVVAPLLALTVWVAISTLRADSLTLGILRAREIMLYPLLYLAALYAPATERWRRQLITWLLVAFGIIIVLCAFQWWAAADSAVLRFDPAAQVWIPRLSATLGHPSVLGQYLILITSFTLPWLLSRQLAAKVTAGSILIIAALVMYLTYSRAVWLGFTASSATIILAFFAANFHTQRSWGKLTRWGSTVLIAAILLGTILYALTPIGVFVRSAFDPRYQSNADRLEFLARLIGATTNTQALIGAGLGDVTTQNFRTANITSFDIAVGASRTVQLAKESTLVDNQHLKTFIEMGLVGVLLYGWLYWRIGTHAWHLARHSLHDETKWLSATLGLGTLGFCIAFIIQGFFIDVWDVFPTNLFFWFIAGLLSAQLSQLSPKNTGSTLHQSSRRVYS